MGDDIDVHSKVSPSKPEKDGNQDELIMQQQRKIEQEVKLKNNNSNKW